MGTSRTIFAIILALAVAVVPAVGGAAGVVDAVDAAAAAPVHDCCDKQAAPCDQEQGGGAVDNCASVAVCAAKCFNFNGSFACEVSYAPVGAVRVTSVASLAAVSCSGAPPFRPPRV